MMTVVVHSADVRRRPGLWILIRGRSVAVALALAWLLPSVRAEKVFFRDELTGAEMWQLTRFDSFHVYSNSYRPFSHDGKYICANRARQRAYVLDLHNGAVTLLGSPKVRAGYPFFLFGRGRPGLVYFSRDEHILTAHLHWLDTGEERVIGQLPPYVNTLHNAGEGLIGPKSEYVPLCGDLNGDGLADFGLWPLWEKGPPKILLTSPTAGFYGKTVSPGPARNLLGLTKVNCHPDIIARANAGEKLPWAKCVSDARLESYIVRVDFQTCRAELFPAKRVRFLTHEAFSGDDKLMFRGTGAAWKITPPGSGVPFAIGDLNYYTHSGNHWGTCGLDGRYLVADSGYDGMERLLMLDLWTGEASHPAHIGTPTRPVSRISQDHGHPGGSPDGTKVIAHSCYDLVRHRLYGVPTEEVLPGAEVIPVETTEGFAPSGRLLVRHGYNRNDLVVSYERKDATHFFGCDWGKDAAAQLKKATRKDKIEKGSHVISDLDGRLFPDGRLRPRKEVIAVIRNPAPPRMPSLALEGKAVRIRWLPPARCLETAGYAVYRQVATGPPQRLTDTVVTACEFVDRTMLRRDSVRYWIRAVEQSGLYSDWSPPVGVTGGAPQTAVLDAYDIAGTMYLAPGEKPESDRRNVRFGVPAPGTYTLWVRCQAPYGTSSNNWTEDRRVAPPPTLGIAAHNVGGAAMPRPNSNVNISSEMPFGAETFGLALDGKAVGKMTVTEPGWHWARAGAWHLPPGEHELVLSRSVTYEIAAGNAIGNPGFEQGMDNWDVPKGITTLDTTAPHAGSNCLKMSGDLTDTQLFQKVKLRGKLNRYYRLSFWVRAIFTKAGSASRFYSDHPNTSGAFWVDAQPLTDPFDRIIYGDRFHATEWRRIVAEVHVRPGSNVSEIRIRPFLGHPTWGEQQGTVWIDDVEFTELGPRQRPVKATKLLVTNVDGYVPEGKNGRSAYAFPATTPVAVTGLRQTSSTRNSIALEWRPTRPGTRGCNVYINAGDECPVTKYFRQTTVWGVSSALLQDLPHTTRYTVKVTALNEDGVEGPAATVRAQTADLPPETCSAKATQMPAAAPLCLRTEAGITYLVTPKDPKDRLAHSDLKGNGLPTGTAMFEFTVREGGEYRIWGRLFARNGGSNSFFFSLDGAEEFQWSVESRDFGRWTWMEPLGGIDYWNLKPGKHTITMRTRESGTRLAQLVVTNDLRPHPPLATKPHGE